MTLSNGIFDVLLGSGTNPLNLVFDKPYYLAIQVGSDPEMTPRQEITSVGYAYKAETAEKADTVDGIHASTTPEANKLLALDASSKLPASVVPSSVSIKAWVNFDGTANPPVIKDGYNVASITRNSAGDYTIFWQTPFVNANYCLSGMAGPVNPAGYTTFHVSSYTLATTSSRIIVAHDGGVPTDRANIMIMAVGN